MRKYFIRDDDTSYFTSVEQLKSAYEDLWCYGPIGLAIIPFSVKTLNQGETGNLIQDSNSEHFIGENIELVNYIKKLIKEDKVYIMLHGYNHYYLPSENNSKYPYRVAEFIYRSDQLRIIKEGKEALENLFGVPIKWFIPPSNALTIETISACDSLQLNLPLLYPLKDRFTANLLNNPKTFFVNRFNIISNFNYPLRFKNHLEIKCTSYTSVTDFNSNYVRRKRNMVIATHYWELLKYPELKLRIIDDIKFYNNKIHSLNLI